MTEAARKEAYGADITYVTNSELGFDYLRDNLAVKKEDLVLRDFNFCIIDEVSGNKNKLAFPREREKEIERIQTKG